LMGGLFFLKLMFFISGTAIAAAAKKPKTAPSIATAILLVTFILSFFINLNSHLNDLKYLTPFKYFDAHTLITTGRLDPLYVVISLALVAAMTALTYHTYTARDLNT